MTIPASEPTALELLASGASLGDVLAALVLGLERERPGMLCSVLLLDDSGRRLRHGAAPSLPGAYNDAVDGIAIGPDVGSCGTAADRKERVVVSDISTDPRWAGYRELALSHGLRACWSSPIFSSRGDVLGTFAVYYREPRAPTADEVEIVERARHLARLAIEHRRAVEALERREAYLRAIIAAEPECVKVLAPDGTLIDMNPAGLELIGARTMDELRGKPLAELVLPEYQPAHAAFLARALSGEQATAELEINTLAGARLFVETTGVPLRDAQGRVTSVLAVTRDMTERRRLEAELRHAQRLEAVGRLAGGIAHDFNNLLTVITGYAELLVAELPADGAPHAEAQEVLSASRAAAAMTAQLLAFSRKQVLQPRPLDLNAVVTGIEKLLRRAIGEHVELVTALGSGLSSIEADAGQLEQVLMNLALNARDAMPRGGRLTIETGVEDVTADLARRHAGARVGPHATLTVKDSGAGMDAATLERIFEPFFTTKDKGRGTGLGLASVHGIVHQSGGFIVVTSEPGRGSTFRVYLPLSMATVEPAQSSASEPSHDTERAGAILLVENEVLVRRLARRVLEEAGHEVSEAAHGAEAVRLWRERGRAFDLLVTDVVMPRQSGPDLAAELRRLRPDLRVLFMSGHADVALDQNLSPGGRTDFLQKPFTPEALRRAVRQLLERATADGGAPARAPRSQGTA